MEDKKKKVGRRDRRVFLYNWELDHVSGHVEGRAGTKMHGWSRERRCWEMAAGYYRAKH